MKNSAALKTELKIIPPPPVKHPFGVTASISKNLELLENLAARRDFLLREIGQVASSSKKTSRI